VRTPWIVEVLIVDLCNKKRDSVAYYQRLDKMKQRLTYVNSYPIYWLPLHKWIWSILGTMSPTRLK